MTNKTSYHEDLYSSTKIKEIFKENTNLDNKSPEELDIMIETIKSEIQLVSGNKSLFVSSLSIIVAMLIVVVGTGMAAIIILTAYMILFIVYYLVSTNELKKLYDRLNNLRYLKDNKMISKASHT